MNAAPSKPADATVFETVDFRCPCGKLLCRVLVRVSSKVLSLEELKDEIKRLEISHGAAVKCRNCKVERKIEREFKVA